MKRMILASHGSLAKGMKSAVSMIVGNTDYITDFNLDDYCSPDDIKVDIEKMIKDSSDEYIVITDIKGGSVCTSLSQLCRYENTTLVTTMSLPLVLEIYMQLMNETITFDLLINTVSLALKNCDVLNKDTILKKMFKGKEEEEW